MRQKSTRALKLRNVPENRLTRQRRDGRTTIAQAVRRRPYSRRQPDVARPLQFQQQCAAGHVLELATRVAPVPAAAQFLAQWRAAPRRVRGQQSADQFDIRVGHLAPLQNHDLCHGAKSTANPPTESSPKNELLSVAFGGGRLSSVMSGLAGANSLRCPPVAGGHLSSYQREELQKPRIPRIPEQCQWRMQGTESTNG